MACRAGVSHLLCRWLLSVVGGCCIASAAHAGAVAAGDAATSKGVSRQDWSRIRAAYEAGRHAITVDDDGALVARNPGQRWLTRFDGQGYTVTPDAGGWTWGLELRSVGFASAQPTRRVSDARRAIVSHDGSRLHYDWSPTLREWFVNDARGLEQGWTISAQPEPGKGGEPLRLELAVRGVLLPRVSSDGRAVSFIATNGGSVLSFAGLKAWDAEGKALAVRFETAGDAALRVAVDERGARYPITIDPVAQQAYLKASNSETVDLFGESVAVSGNTVVVGAKNERSTATGVNGDQSSNGADFSGAAYVFVRNGTAWTQQAYLKASNARFGEFFGDSVAVSGDTVVVGAPFEDSNATGVNGDQGDISSQRAGAAYVFVRSGTTWTQQAYLKASNTGAADNFGASVAVSGDTIVVGAHQERSAATGVDGNQADDSLSSPGAAYVFVRGGTTWTQQAYLKASNTEAEDQFGWAVAVSGDTLVVGAPGEDSNATGVDGNQADNSVVLAGAAYVFVRNGTSWTQQAYLKASNTGANDVFGISVAVSGDTVVAGAREEDSDATGVDGDQGNNNGFDSGAAYVFVRSGTSWTQQAYLKAGNSDANDYFGGSVAVSGDTVVVGATGEDSNATGVNGNQADNSVESAGAAYVFVRSGTTWSQQNYLKASNAGASDLFGTSVSASVDTLVVGAEYESSNATGVDGNQADNSAEGSGAAYVFAVTELPSPVIFIPGISGSTLVDHPLGAAEEVWVGFPAASRRSLSLYAVDNPPPPDPNAKDIDATDATRLVAIGQVVVSEIYRPLLAHLAGPGGYREYDVGGFPFRRTTAGCDLEQIDADPNLTPNLFVFAYDWRKDNAQTAAKLKDYVGCVKQLHPGSKVTLLTHSMGGLVARRYVLDNPADHHVDKTITLVAPWLGAAKVLNVLETGDFIPAVAAGDDMKYVAPSLPAAAQLLSSRAYFELGGAPMLVEDGHDADGDGQRFETYQYDEVVEYIDEKYRLPAQTFPGTTNRAFHSYARPAGAQDDWSVDTTGVEYFHLYGVQAGNLTIAQLVARDRVVCEPNPLLPCRFRTIFDLRFTVGDATVPARSAGRSTSFGNYNAAPADHIFRFAVSDAAENNLVDHTEICQNPVVLNKVLELLGSSTTSPPARHASGPDSAQRAGGLPATADELPSTTPSYYVTLDGATPLIASDTQGNSTATIANDVRGSVPGVQTYRLGGGVEMVTLPVPATEEYSLTFLSNGSPIELDVIQGVDNVTPSVAIRYLDTTLPLGVLARIQIAAAGVGTLQYDSDGNGTFDTPVPPTVSLSGPAALDATPPTISASQSVQGSLTEVSLLAVDGGAGLAAGSLRYSFDRTQYQPYATALSLDSSVTPFVYAIADDNAGNRRVATIQIVNQAILDHIFADGFEP